MLRWLTGLGMLLVLLQAAPSFTTEASYTYGQSVRFVLRVPAAAPPLTAVTLFVQPDAAATAVAVTVPTALDAAQVVHELSAAQLGLTPFATVSYWWQVDGAAGASWTTPVDSFLYEDNRLPWQTQQSSNIVVHWVDDVPELGATAVGIAQAAQSRLAPYFASETLAQTTIYIYPATTDIQSTFRLAGRQWPLAAGEGVDVVLVTAVNRKTAVADLQQSIPPALARLYWQRAGAGRIPLWFQEGMAHGLGGAPQGQRPLAAPLSFVSLCKQFPAEGVAYQQAAAQSAALVTHIEATYGWQALRQLGEQYAAGADCVAGVTAVLGVSGDQLLEQTTEGAASTLQTFLRSNGLWLLLLLGSIGFSLLMVRK